MQGTSLAQPYFVQNYGGSALAFDSVGVSKGTFAGVFSEVDPLGEAAVDERCGRLPEFLAPLAISFPLAHYLIKRALGQIVGPQRHSLPSSETARCVRAQAAPEIGALLYGCSMQTEFRKVVLPDELRRLVAFDARIFSKSDRFGSAEWKGCESYWMIVEGKTVGCCAFEKHVDFGKDENPRCPGSLFIATTGIHPKYQGKGFGNLMKTWQVCYARHHGFTRVVTNTRKSNAAMIALNRKHGFRVVRTTSRYYPDGEATVVMELLLNGSPYR